MHSCQYKMWIVAGVPFVTVNCTSNIDLVVVQVLTVAVTGLADFIPVETFEIFVSSPKLPLSIGEYAICKDLTVFRIVSPLALCKDTARPLKNPCRCFFSLCVANSTVSFDTSRISL